MRICSEHWERLRVLICERGLGHLLHHPHDEFEEFTAELCGRPVRAMVFDPLDAARLVAERIAIRHGGPQLRRDRCPLCEIVHCLPAHDAISSEAYWPGVIVGQVLHEARSRGLMPRAA